MRRSITQKDSFGCGVACVAFLVGESYESIVYKMGRNKVAKTGYLGRELLEFVRNYYPEAEFKYLKSYLRRKIYLSGTIVFIKRSKKYPYGHYLIRYKDYWMDPWINLPTDKNVEMAVSGFRKRLPDKPIYALFTS